MGTETTECAIICMPFASVIQPPLGVSVLKRSISDFGVDTVALYPSVRFSELVPYPVYEWLSENSYERLADYYFSRMAFGWSARADEAFKEMLDSLGARKRMPHCLCERDRLGILRQIENACTTVIDETVESLASLRKLKVVACSATFIQLYASLALLRNVKKRLPHVITMIGGAECEGLAALELVGKLPFLDYSFSGEGDRTFPMVVKSVISCKREFCLPAGAYDADKALHGNVEHPMANPAEFCVADHSDYMRAIQSSRWLRRIRPAMTIEFSRGCWKGMRSQCRFCGFNGERMNFRQKNCSGIEEELFKMYECGIRFFQATDTVLDFHAMRTSLESFSRKCKDAVIICDTVSTLKEEQLKFLAKCGVLFLQVGIETLHPKHVKLLNKGNSAIGSIAFLKFARENSITVFWNVLTSIPGDTPTDYREMCELVKCLEHLTPPHFGVIRFDRFSEYWRNPERYGLHLVPAKNCRYLLPEESGLDSGAITMVFDNLNETVRTNYTDESIASLESAISTWQEHDRTMHPMLMLKNSSVVEDTREVANERFYTLTQDERSLLKWLRNPRAKQEIEGKGKDMALRELINRKFVIEWDDKFLSLVLESSVPISPERMKVIEDRLNIPQLISQREKDRR